MLVISSLLPMLVVSVLASGGPASAGRRPAGQEPLPNGTVTVLRETDRGFKLVARSRNGIVKTPLRAGTYRLVAELRQSPELRRAPERCESRTLQVRHPDRTVHIRLYCSIP
jgi:hypothetical protein